jgi:hypothetical protein
MSSTNEKSATPFQLSKLRDSVIDQASFQRRYEVNLIDETNLLTKSLHHCRAGIRNTGILNERDRLHSSLDTPRWQPGSAQKDGLDTANRSPRVLERLRTPSYPVPSVSLKFVHQYLQLKMPLWSWLGKWWFDVRGFWNPITRDREGLHEFQLASFP